MFTNFTIRAEHGDYTCAARGRRKKGKCIAHFPFFNCGAGEESRTLDLYLGKVSLYQLSYSRENLEARAGVEPTYTDLQSGA